ncbi:MAG: ABC transporter permease [Kosmotogaceae bacterium]
MSHENKLKFKKIYCKYPNLTVLGGLFALTIILFSISLPDKFFSISNFSSMAFQLPELGLLTLAMAITMLSGGINLSIIANANLAGIIMATLMKTMMGTGTDISLISLIIAISAGLLVSSFVGFLNGTIIAYIGVSPILATLGTMTLLNGLSILFTKGYVISGLPEKMVFFGNGSILGIPFPFIIFLVTLILVGFWLRKTPSGFSNYLIGSNETATRFSGINTKKVIMKTYIVSGFLSGLAAVVMISRFNSARAGYAESYLLVTVLASVFGGYDPNGGFGKVLGLFLSLFILQLVSSGLNLLGVSSYLTIALWGLILIAVMVLHKFQPKTT